MIWLILMLMVAQTFYFWKSSRRSNKLIYRNATQIDTAFQYIEQVEAQLFSCVEIGFCVEHFEKSAANDGSIS